MTILCLEAWSLLFKIGQDSNFWKSGGNCTKLEVSVPPAFQTFPHPSMEQHAGMPNLAGLSWGRAPHGARLPPLDAMPSPIHQPGGQPGWPPALSFHRIGIALFFEIREKK